MFGKVELCEAVGKGERVIIRLVFAMKPAGE